MYTMISDYLWSMYSVLALLLVIKRIIDVTFLLCL